MVGTAVVVETTIISGKVSLFLFGEEEPSNYTIMRTWGDGYTDIDYVKTAENIINHYKEVREKNE
jgi:hypothetical protein